MPNAKRSDDLPRMVLSLVAQEAMEITCNACGVTMFDLMAKRRSRAHVSYARQIAMYLAHVVGQLSLGDISIAFDRDRTTVGYACHTVEDRRDSPIFDKQIEELETEMRARMNTLFSRYRLRAAPSDWDVRLARMQLKRA